MPEYSLAMGGRGEWIGYSYSPHLEDLAALGADVYQGHDPSRIDGGVDLVVASAAVPQDDPELQAAHERGIRVVSRAELLGEIMRPRRGE